VGGDQHDSLPRRTQHFRVIWIVCTKAEIYEVHSVPRGPIDCAQQRLYVRGQRLVKDFHREYFGIGRLLANCRCHCCAVAEAI